MDLSNIKQSDTAVINLHLPDAEETPLINPDKTPMTVEVHGSYSEAYRTAIDNQQDRRIKKASRAGGKATFTAEEMRANRLELVVACVKAWNITIGGVCPPCTPEEVKKVVLEYPFIRVQIELAIETPEHFLETSLKN